jgi:protein-disulfide isomerase
MPVSNAMSAGSLTANVAIVMFSDFQCPFCKRFVDETLPRLRQEYVTSGRVRVFFLQDPLPFHPQARKAAEADVCAARHGRGWEMHDALFADQAHLDPPSLYARANSIGLDPTQFAKCLTDEAKVEVDTDIIQAISVRLIGTPEFLIGIIRADGKVQVTRRLSGALPLEQFAAVLDPLLATSRNQPTGALPRQ